MRSIIQLYIQDSGIPAEFTSMKPILKSYQKNNWIVLNNTVFTGNAAIFGDPHRLRKNSNADNEKDGV